MRYEEYYELWERTSWKVSELPWADLAADDAAGLISQFDRDALVGTAVIEHGVPHYSEVWSLVDGLRDHWELWQFTTLWTADEHRHSFVLKKACEALGLSAPLEPDLDAVKSMRFAEAQKQVCPDDCYRTVPGMTSYAVIQELATNHFYLMAAKATKSPFLKKMFTLIAGDEMRHHCFYRDALKGLYETSPDRPWFVDQVFHSTQAFKMPHLIYQLQVPFFESDGWKVSTDMFGQLARCFSFDGTLIGRLAAIYQPAA